MIERVLYFVLGAAVFSAIYTLVVTRFGPIFGRWLRRRHAQRLHGRLARGSDRYFEELRSIQSGMPPVRIAHGFAWHFVRAFAFMLLIFTLDRLTDFLFQF